jgi:hypothetical protein
MLNEKLGVIFVCFCPEWATIDFNEFFILSDAIIGVEDVFFMQGGAAGKSYTWLA